MMIIFLYYKLWTWFKSIVIENWMDNYFSKAIVFLFVYTDNFVVVVGMLFWSGWIKFDVWIERIFLFLKFFFCFIGTKWKESPSQSKNLVFSQSSQMCCWLLLFLTPGIFLSATTRMRLTKTDPLLQARTVFLFFSLSLFSANDLPHPKRNKPEPKAAIKPEARLCNVFFN